jgi:hypothetical protein
MPSDALQNRPFRRFDQGAVTLKHMSPVPRTRKRKKRKTSSLLWLWPIIVGLIVTPFAVRAASVLALSGPAALKILLPFVAFMQAHWTPPLAGSGLENYASWAMWVQFPAYGLLAALAGRVIGAGRALLLVLALHVAAVVAALLLVR